MKAGIQDYHLTDEYAAKQTADKICGCLRRYIPEACYREAWNEIAEACFKEGHELTSKLMRKEYVAWKSTQVDLTKFNKE